MSRIKVDSISDRNNSSSPTLLHGATIPNGNLNINGSVNFTGISTIVGFVTATDFFSSGIVTATSFVGDGSQLQGVQSVSESKSIALKVILDPLPFRS